MPIDYENACETEKKVLQRVYDLLKDGSCDEECGEGWSRFQPKDIAPASRTWEEWQDNHEEWLLEGLGVWQKKWLTIDYFSLFEAEENSDSFFFFYNHKTDKIINGADWLEDFDYDKNDFDAIIERDGSDWTFWAFSYTNLIDTMAELKHKHSEKESGCDCYSCSVAEAIKADEDPCAA